VACSGKAAMRKAGICLFVIQIYILDLKYIQLFSATHFDVAEHSLRIEK
jgi:hypothetical protein